ncbi:uncharacterized protein [Pyrus communis]|uniref:uncharacterized protein n=1 Tax=Pyrus communis TaxID=23211 RepID=UPI0035C115FF
MTNRPDIIIAKAINWWQDFQKIALMNCSSPASRISLSWTIPPPGCLKINVYGALRESEMLGTVGLVVRNHLGRFVAAKALVFEFVSSPLHIEALTVWDGLLLVIQRGYHDIIIESDALQIVPTLHNGLPNGSLIGNIVEDSKALLSTITGATAAHTRRQNYEAAHLIARYALSSLTSCSWTMV